MEWKEVRLESILALPSRNGLTKPSKIRGKGVKMIGMGELFANPIIYDIPMDRVPVTDKELFNSRIMPGDLLFARQSLTLEGAGKCCYVKEVKEETVFESHLIRIRIDKTKADAEFIYYFFNSFIGKCLIQNLVTQVAAAGIRGSELVKLEITIPKELEDQRRIASILSSLDRKIELNNKINADLEEMAQAIFKNWFVDFEPFKDGKFVDSELGMIPEGWKIGSYSEMVDSLISGDWGKENPQGNYTHEVACVRGCDFQDINNGVRGKTPQRYILEKNYQAKHLKDKDILVEISGGTATVSTGRTSLVTEELLKKYKHDIVCTNFCKVLRPLSQFSSYVYYSWKYKYDNDIMFGYENGTSGIKNFAIKDFIEKEPVLIPKEQDIVEFQKIIDNLQKQKQIKGTENTTLSLLRDTLLPRLMSGELEVPE